MSQKKDSEQCPSGCHGRILDAKRGTYCKCISDLLPRGSQQSVDTESWDDIDKASGLALKEPHKPRIEEELIEAKMREYGCNETEISMVMDRNCEELTLAEIAQKFGYTTPQSADRALEQIYKKLRKAGFNLEESE